VILIGWLLFSLVIDGVLILSGESHAAVGLAFGCLVTLIAYHHQIRMDAIS
jgi:hypothetical protein